MPSDRVSAPRLSRRVFLQTLAGGAAMVAAKPALARAAGLAAGADATGAVPVRSSEPLQLAWVSVSEAADAGRLAGFDLTHARRPGAVEVLLWPGDLDRLAATGLDYEVTVADLAATAVPTTSRAADYNDIPGAGRDYRHLEHYETDLRWLARRYPNTVKLFELPARTAEGRTVLGVEVCDQVHRRDGRPVFYIDGVHHAREWPSGELVMMFLYDLVQRGANDADLGPVLRNVRTVAVPVVNVDGFVHSRESALELSDLGAVAGGQGAYWRKNRRSVADEVGNGAARTTPAGRDDPSSYGVDVNRNYPMLWGGPGASEVPTDADYRGPSASSEPETRNIIWLARRHQIITAVTNHTYGNLVLRPWGHEYRDSLDEPQLASLGARAAAFNGYQNIKGIALYPTTGTTEDFLYGAFGTFAYTFEHGTSFHPPYQDVVDAYVANRLAFAMIARAATATWANVRIVARVIDRNGMAIPAVVTLDRTTELPIRGDRAENLVNLGTDTISMRQTSVHEFATGQVLISATPSTSPASRLEDRHRHLGYVATFTSPGRGRVQREVIVDRGSTVDLGTIVL